MMGHHARSEALFYYFRLEDQVPETHKHSATNVLVVTGIAFWLCRKRILDIIELSVVYPYCLDTKIECQRADPPNTARRLRAS